MHGIKFEFPPVVKPQSIFYFLKWVSFNLLKIKLILLHLIKEVLFLCFFFVVKNKTYKFKLVAPGKSTINKKNMIGPLKTDGRNDVRWFKATPFSTRVVRINSRPLPSPHRRIKKLLLLYIYLIFFNNWFVSSSFPCLYLLLPLPRTWLKKKRNIQPNKPCTAPTTPRYSIDNHTIENIGEPGPFD